ncbi:MAG: sigma-70 family RNA polymerase sigma factor [Ruminococcus sp.]|nr:sigma-70 family RNA polymerase sigma factor [Ruminococcus sp.]
MINIYLSVLDTAEDKAEFEDLYIKYKQRMYAVAYKILNNVEDAEDAVHDTFIKIADNFEMIKKFSCQELQSYIVIIVRNTSINIYRKNQKNSEYLTRLDDNQITINVDFFENIDRDELIKAISNLPLIYKDILFLHYFRKYTTKEISEMLAISVDAVWKRIERAKKLLKEKLEKGE